MTAWPLHALLRFRTAEAREATRRAGVRCAEALRARRAAEELGLRAAEGRRSAASTGEPVPAGLAGGLASAASYRAATDRAARRAARDGERAALEAEGAKSRALEAATGAREAKGREEPLARGLVRWEGKRRSAREAGLEREVEEAWSATRGTLPQVEACPALLALDLEPPGPEVARCRLAAALELGRGEHHLLARTQGPLLALPGPVEGEHDVGPDLVRLVAHEDLLPAQQGVLEDVHVGADRVARTGRGAGDPQGQEGGDEPPAHQAEPRPLPAPRLPESVDQVGRRATPLVERPLDEARDALRSIAHGVSLPSVRSDANVPRDHHGACAREDDGV